MNKSSRITCPTSRIAQNLQVLFLPKPKVLPAVTLIILAYQCHQTDIIIEDSIVFTDPYEEADEQLKKEREEDQEKQQKETEQELKKKKKPEEVNIKVYKQGVGKYINSSSVKRAMAISTEDETDSKKKKTAYQFGNFSSW